MTDATRVGFQGARVAAFESRMAGAMGDLIRKHGGEPLIAPSLREVPLEDGGPALAFARALQEKRFDIVIFLTGVGTRYMARTIETQIPRADWTEALRHVEVVARGPKPMSALRELGVRVDLQVPEPNTWNEILAALDGRRDLGGTRVAVQEYGKPSPELVAGLEQRGAHVTSIPIYRWALPEDLEPLRAVVRQIASGSVTVALFTSAQQVVHLLQVADGMDLGPAVRQALARQVVIGSIGPTTTEMLEEHGLEADLCPDHPKMGHLVAVAAAAWPASVKSRVGEPARARTDDRGESADPLANSPFLRACRREPTPVTPIWLMRQAGRYMSEYRSVRSKVGFLELCKNPELATEVTVTAAEVLGVDAAILFADILLILEPLGFDLEFAKGEGPVIHNPIRETADVDRVTPLPSAEPLSFVYEAVRQIRAALKPDLPLIGFAGAPFTLACYAIEGGGSRHYDKAKAYMYRDPSAFSALMSRLVDATVLYLNAQAAAGAQVLQLFDSWVGTLSPDDYRQNVLPHMTRLFQGLTPGVPTIHFGTGTGGLLELQRQAGGDVIGLDWRIELDKGWDRLGSQVAVQGNLDPVTLLGPRAGMEAQARRILERAAGRPGHIFNLGHGILPTTPVDNVKALVELVHAESQR